MYSNIYNDIIKLNMRLCLYICIHIDNDIGINTLGYLYIILIYILLKKEIIKNKIIIIYT